MTTATATDFRSALFNLVISPQFAIGQKPDNRVYVNGPTGGEHLLAYVAIVQDREDGHTEPLWITSATRSGIEDAFWVLHQDSSIEVRELRLPTSDELTEFQKEQDRDWQADNNPTYFDGGEF